MSLLGYHLTMPAGCPFAGVSPGASGMAGAQPSYYTERTQTHSAAPFMLPEEPKQSSLATTPTTDRLVTGNTASPAVPTKTLASPSVVGPDVIATAGAGRMGHGSALIIAGAACLLL